MKKPSITIFVFILFSLSLPSFSQTVITVRDTIWADEIWSADTVKVDTNIFVVEGAILTINPGTYVEFQECYMIEIFGSLKAIGTPDDSIVFTIRDTTLFHNPDTTKGGWSGIYFRSVDTSYLQFCRFTYTKKINDPPPDLRTNLVSIYLYYYGVLNISQCHFSNNNKRVISGGSESSLFVDSCLFEENTDICISTGQGKCSISNCIFRKNICTRVIYAYNGEISSNFIYDNQGVGIYIRSTIRVEIVNNLIANNSEGGISINESDPLLANNTICNNLAYSGGGIRVSQTSSPVLISNIIWNNQASFSGDQIYIEYFSKTYIRNSVIEGGLDSIGYGTGSSYKGEYISNIENDPAFVNAPAGIGDGYASEIADWALTDTSPCINQGLVEEGYSLPWTDLLGTRRISHGFVDIGALEYHKESLEASSNIDSSIIWIADTVKVMDNIEIGTDQILSVAPGTIVEFQGPFKLQCSGAIRALGKATDTIYFTASDTVPGWKGIHYYIVGEGKDTSVFRFVNINRIVDSADHGIYFSNIPYVEISNSVFENNVVERLLALRTTKANISRSSFINNRGPSFYAILSIYSDLTVDACLFYKNKSLEDPSNLIYHSRGNMDVLNSYFYNNELKGYGRLIYKSSGNDVNISNTIIANNQSFSAVYAVNMTKSIQISNMTITRNTSEYGRWILADGNNDDSKFTMTNSILQGNSFGTDSLGDIIYLSDINSEIMNNNIQGGIDSIYKSGSDIPLLYQDNLDTLPGFLKPTAGVGPAFDALNADWGLSIFSPCLDKGISDYDDLPSADFDILGNPRVVGNNVDLGAIENQSEPLEITSQPDNLFLCEGETATFSAIANDSAIYQWEKDGIPIENADSATLVLDSILYSDQGNYKCTITNGFGSVSSNSAYLLVKLPPKILAELRDLWATPGEDILLKPVFSGSEPISYVWKKDGLPIPGELYPELLLSPADSSDEGMYSFEPSNSCGTVSTVPISVYLAPQLCMVTVSEVSGHNLIIWEKESKAPILSYNVYRESSAAGIYDRLVTIPYDDLSVFVDTMADPTVQAYLYKITAIDTAGNETDADLCKPHKTIHLLVSTNPELNTTQLEWDRYYGFEYASYFILRSVDGSVFSQVHDMSSNLHSWTDPNPVAGELVYRIAVERPDPCYPTDGSKKAGTGPYNHSLSNLDDNRLQAGQLPPDTITLSNNSIEEENMPTMMIGKLFTEDEDSIDSHTYQFVPGDGDDDNISFTLLGDLLLASESFDYETKSQYSVRIRSTDQAGNYYEITFTILIIDIDETTGLLVISAGFVKAYPNPFSHSTTISYPNPEGKPYRMYLMNIAGKVVKAEAEITSSRFDIEREDLEKGLYFIELIGPETYRGKIIIE